MTWGRRTGRWSTDGSCASPSSGPARKSRSGRRGSCSSWDSPKKRRKSKRWRGRTRAWRFAWFLEEELLELEGSPDRTESPADMINLDLRLPPGLKAVVEVVAGQDVGKVFRLTRGNISNRTEARRGAADGHRGVAAPLGDRGVRPDRSSSATSARRTARTTTAGASRCRGSSTATQSGSVRPCSSCRSPSSDYGGFVRSSVVTQRRQASRSCVASRPSAIEKPAMFSSASVVATTTVSSWWSRQRSSVGSAFLSPMAPSAST